MYMFQIIKKKRTIIIKTTRFPVPFMCILKLNFLINFSHIIYDTTSVLFILLVYNTASFFG